MVHRVRFSAVLEQAGGKLDAINAVATTVEDVSAGTGEARRASARPPPRPIDRPLPLPAFPHHRIPPKNIQNGVLCVRRMR
ncbi:MAG TPA: hypothetical protein VFU49_20805 [Ktedonobacteraceae bacterium]|nr:hypothetical protein [Ktedonobacteraceae bacterium]